MTDKYARERIAELQKELHEIKWELKHKIWTIHEYLGVKEDSEPAKQFLVKKEKGNQ
jgi:hypothetical protein